MLGLGTWEFPINLVFFKGAVQMDITDNGDIYGFTLRIPEYETPPVDIHSVTEEGDALHIVARTAIFKNKDILVDLVFDGDTASGSVKAPFIGKIKLHNGRKIA